MGQSQVKFNLSFYHIIILCGLITLSTSPSNDKDDKIVIHSRHNCSRYKSVDPYDVSDFHGVWHYLRLFTEERTRAEPNCIRLTNRINPSTIVMNITIPHPKNPEKLMSSVVFGAYNSKMEGRAEWVFFSESPLAPSKWIILAQQPRHVLYLICGDFPDGTSAVGEIGILSRGTELEDGLAAAFSKILKQYSLHHVELETIQHNQCPPLELFAS